MTRSILMFCPQFRPIVGGAERQAEKLAKALVQKGARVKVITPQFSADAPLYEEDAGVTIHRFPIMDLCRAFPSLRGLGSLNLLLLRRQVVRAVEQHLADADIVHTHIASPMTAFAMQAAKRRRLPVLCKVASAGPPNEIDCVAQAGLGGRWIRNRLLRDMTCWVATTQAVRQSLLTSGVQSSRVITIPNGVSLVMPSAKSSINGSGFRFLYLGRLSSNSQRDAPTLIRAFDRLADQLPKVELALVGTGDQLAETADHISQCRHVGRIQLPGLSEPEPWLRWADSFVLPSRCEGLSNALLEAMAAGLPCIVNDIPPNREVLADGAAGVLVPIGDEDQLLAAMQHMATDAMHADVMRCAARQRVIEHYGIDAVAEQYLALYELLIRDNQK